MSSSCNDFGARPRQAQVSSRRALRARPSHHHAAPPALSAAANATFTELRRLGLDEHCSDADVKKKYRALALKLHPDKGGDRERFLAAVDAYGALTGREHRPYGDLYRSVCVDVVGACASEEDVEASKRFFPRYDGSAKFPPAPAKKRKRRRRRKEL